MSIANGNAPRTPAADQPLQAQCDDSRHGVVDGVGDERPGHERLVLAGYEPGVDCGQVEHQARYASDRS